MAKCCFIKVCILGLVLVFASGLIPVCNSAAAADILIYSDSLLSGWENWSWSTGVNFSSTSAFHGGSYSISVIYNAAWAGLYLHADAAVDLSGYDHLSFWIHGGSAGNQHLKVVANGDGGNAYQVTAQANSWTQVNIPLSALGSPSTLSDLYWQDTTGGAQPMFYLDDITLVSRTGPPPPPPPPGTGPVLSIDANAGRHPISEGIYGMNFADEQTAAELRLPLRRWGGNSTSRYNWQNDTYNTGSDWYFENIREDNSNPSALPDGSAADRFVEQDRRTGTKTLMTVPLIGWVSKRRVENHPYDCGFSVAKYGAQQSVDQWDTNCGNGVYPSGSNIVGNDPSDTSSAVGPDFITSWINHLVGKYGKANGNGVAYYALDNEPMLWNSTHRDVHPQPTTYNELRDRAYQYAAAIKTADPSAQTLGPVLWGWCAYFYSALDGCSIGTDYQSHGNTAFVAWYLQQMKAYEQQHGLRIVDYLDLHYYPAANGVSLKTAGNSSTQALRLRSTRSLWDPSYVDESWISDLAQGGIAVRMIPRMKDWVNNNYPGTKLAITEYNWGGLESINGALAQADVLGIFGREGLDIATLWGLPSLSQPGAFAFRLYRNYDSAGHGFGDVSVQAASADQGLLSVYAAIRNTDKALTIIVINKTPGSLTSVVNIAGFTPASNASAYQYSDANPASIVQLADQPTDASGFSATFAGNSITLFVIKPRSVNPGKDFNSDGKTDILWRNSVTGDVYLWTMNGTSRTGGVLLGDLADSNWQIVGTGYFSGGSTPDILWRNASTGDVYLWTMIGMTHTGGVLLGNLADSNWQIVGTGYFSGGSTPDILWRNASTGDVYLWTMIGTTHAGGVLLGNLADSNWQIVGTDYFSGGSTPDILWRNASTGDVYLWTMIGTTHTGGVLLGNLADSNWQIVGTGYFSGGSTPDILWRNASTGDVYLWTLSGMTHTGGVLLGNVPDSNWQIVGH